MIALTFWITGAEHEKKSPPGATPLKDPPGIHNLYSLGDGKVYSGSSPETDEAFAALAKLGVKTIITVDGAKPNVELAKKHGMRYAHLPHGYDGIDHELRLKLAKAGETLPGPFYIHCHHGKHRGPAAAAVVCMSGLNWSADQAEAWLIAAGTSTNYVGLYDMVREFKKPSAEELAKVPPEFPEMAKVSGLVDAMVGIDKRWEHLKAVQEAGYGVPKNHPDIEQANEAVILWELYREAQRLTDAAQHGADFVERLKKAEADVKEAEQLLRQYAAQSSANVRTRLDASFKAIGQSCASCHKAYRN